MARGAQPIAWPSLRRWLMKVHRDLFHIDDNTIAYSEYYGPLTTVEIIVLLLEDRRFFHHIGVDWVSCLRDFLKLITFRKHGGSSTIDMQFVRTVTGYREITIRRKIYEITLALLIQFKYSKVVILRSYLNRAFFGSHLIGIDRASRQMFSTYWNSLDVDQAAIIAAMLVYPKPLNPTERWVNKVGRRANYGKALYVRHKKRFEKIPGWEQP